MTIYKNYFLCADGIKRKEKPIFFDYLYYDEKVEMWINKDCKNILEVTDLCIFIVNSAFDKIIGNQYQLIEFYEKNIKIFDAGLTAESGISKDEFNKYLISFKEDYKLPTEIINKFIYISDVRYLIFQIENCYSEILSLVSDFYFTLNTGKFCSVKNEKKSSVTMNTGYESRKIHSLANMFFIRAFSLYDYIHKVAHEILNPVKCFKTHKKMSSHSTTNSKKINLKSDISGTLFENSENKIFIRTIRDQIIHNGFLDEFCYFYKKWESEKIIEKYILLPDTEKGLFTKSGSRFLFYGKENKTNIIILELIKDISNRLIKSLKGILIESDPIFNSFLDKKNINFECHINKKGAFYIIEDKILFLNPKIDLAMAC